MSMPHIIQGHFIASDEKDADIILKNFKAADAIQLPIVDPYGKVTGLVNLFDLLDASGDDIPIIRDYCTYNKTDDLSKFQLDSQQLYLVLSKDGLFEGYIRSQDLKYVKEEQTKCEQLNEISNELNTIFEMYSDGMFITDGIGTVLRMNAACEMLDGVKREEVIGQNMKDLVNKGVYSNSVSLDVLKHKKRVTVLQTVKDGKELLATGTPVFKDEKISLVIVNVRDVTELNNLKKELEQTKNMSHKMIRELEALRTEQNLTGNLLLDSPAMHKIIKLAQKVAKVDSTVLILGESGVGKGVLSKFIHENSNRSFKPFIKIDCSAIPESLIESELFGYERGAFSGAEKSGKLGLVEMADGGTLFLDEIGELPLNLQVKLLRLLQDSEFIRVGGKEPIPVNIRVIAATNRNLEQLMEEKRFREDLFYRLNVIPIFIPPLRERREDIYPLIMNFLDIFNRKCNEKKQVDPAAMKILMNNQWPGNVRELENMIERLVVTSNDNNISVHDLPAHLLKQGDPELLMIGETYRQCMDNYEKKLLIKILEVAPNTTDMSRILGIDTSTIRRKLKKHGIDY